MSNQWKGRVLITAFTLTLTYAALMAGQIYVRPPIWPDEAIFASIADNLAHRGVFGTVLYKEFIPGSETYTLWYPPVYFLVLASVFKMFGTGILAMRALSVTASAAAVFFLYLLLARSVKNTIAAVIPVFFLAADVFFRSGSVIGRMEIVTLAFGLSGILALWGNFRLRYQLAGILFSLSVMTHPLGALFPAAAILGCSRRPSILKRLAAFSLPTVIFVALWIVLHRDALDVLAVQLTEQAVRKRYLTPYILQLLNFRTEEFILTVVYTVLSVTGSVILFVRSPDHRMRTLAWYAALTPWVVFFAREMWYFIYLSVSASLGLAVLTDILWKRRLEAAIGMLLLTGFFLGNALMKDTRTMTGGRTGYEEFGRRITDVIPDRSGLLISAIPDPYFYIAENRPDIALSESPNSPPSMPVDEKRYDRIFAGVQFAVVSYAANDAIAGFLGKNTDRVLYEGVSPTGEQYKVLKLKDAGERIP